jgi:hypothetical protein
MHLNQSAESDYYKAIDLASNDEDRGCVHLALSIHYYNTGNLNGWKSHLITSARLGSELAQNYCMQYGVNY